MTTRPLGIGLTVLLALAIGKAWGLDCVNQQTQQVRHSDNGSCLLGERQIMPGAGAPIPVPSNPITAGPRTVLTPELKDALAALEQDQATAPQKALLFKNNDVINRLRTIDPEVTDAQYQKAQREYVAKSNEFTHNAVAQTSSDLEFKPQTSKPRPGETGGEKIYNPGTDTDNIIKNVTDPDQIRQIKESYNAQVNQYLQEQGVADRPADWAKIHDVDFMADPAKLTDAQFREIGAMNNGPYMRRGAAQVEYILRNEPQTPLQPDQVRSYLDEMQDQAAHKQEHLAALRNDPELFTNPDKQSDYFATMGKAQKYTERIEALTDRVRADNGLPPIDRAVTGEGSISKLGMDRAPDARVEMVSADAVADSSFHRSVGQMAETYAEVVKANPNFAPTALSDIVRVSQSLPPGERGALLQRINVIAGDEFTRGVTEAMAAASLPVTAENPLTAAFNRARESLSNGIKSNPVTNAAGALDNAVGQALGITNSTAEMSVNRQQLNELGGKALEGIGPILDQVFKAKQLGEAGLMAEDYILHWREVMRPDITAAEAEEHLAIMQDLGFRMAKDNAAGAAMTALFEACPHLAAIIGTYTVSYEGTRLVLENTKTGQFIDHAVQGGFDVGFRTGDSLAGKLRQWSGQADADRQKLLDSYENAIIAHHVTLRPGETLQDLRDALAKCESGECTPKQLEWIRSHIVDESHLRPPAPPGPRLAESPLHPPVKTGSVGTAPDALALAQGACATTKGSTAQLNQSGKYDCVCPAGQGPNADGSACGPLNGGGVAAIDQQQAICQKLTPGSQPRKNAEGKFDCVCPAGQELDQGTSSCVAVKVAAAPPPPPPQPSCAQLRGSRLITRPDGTLWCSCPDGQVTNSDSSACISKRDAGMAAAQAYCPRFPGSQAAWHDQDQNWHCDCPQGAVWTNDSTQCVDQVQAATQWCAERVGPDSTPDFRGTDGTYECMCNDGYTYNGTSCVHITAAPGAFGHKEDGSANDLAAALAGALGSRQGQAMAPPPGMRDVPSRAAPPPASAGPDAACMTAVQYMASRGCSFAEVAGDMGYNGANCGPTALYIRPHSVETRFYPKGPNCIFHDCYDLDRACTAMISQCRDSNRFPCR